MDSSKKKFKLSYHWIIFAIGFLIVFTGLGFGSSTRGTYKTAILADLSTGLDNFFLYSFSDTFRYVTTAILNMLFGTLIFRFGARKLVAAGFTCLTLSCVVCSFATQYWHLYVGAVLLGIGFAWTTTTIVGVIVEKWFTNGKGTIMGIILAANGLGGTVSELIITPMAMGEGGAGWRFAYRLTAVIYLVIGALAVIFLRDKPEDKNLLPLGQDQVAKKKKRGADWDGFEMADVLKKPYFYVAGVCIFITGMILQSMNGLSKTHIAIKFGSSNDMVNLIAAIFAVHSLVLMFSKILAGSSFDLFGIRFTFGYCSVFTVVSLVALAITTKETPIFAWIYSVCSSLALPLETIMIPLLVAEMFGKKSHAKIMGYYLGLNVFGYACGGPIADLVKQKSGEYKGILLIFAGVMVVNAIVTQIVFSISKKDRLAYIEKNQK
jgi:MFS family permease